MGLTDILLSSSFFAVYIFRYVAHTKLTELVAEFLIGLLDTVLRIFFWLLRIHVVQRARLYALRRAQEEIEVIGRHLERHQRERRRVEQHIAALRGEGNLR
jgi:hypothetical protein